MNKSQWNSNQTVKHFIYENYSKNVVYVMASILSRRDGLTHWVRVTHKCVGNLTIIGSDNGLSPGRRQAIIWSNAGILLIGALGTNFNEMLIEIRAFSFTKIHLKMSSGKWRPFSLGLNVLRNLLPSISPLIPLWHTSVDNVFFGNGKHHTVSVPGYLSGLSH